MGALILTAAQKAVIQALEAKLEDAFKDGTESPAATPLLPAFDKYDSSVMSADGDKLKTMMKDIFRTIIAAMLTTPGIEDVLAVTPAAPPVAGVFVASYVAAPGGETCTLTFTDGILTAHYEPPPPT